MYDCIIIGGGLGGLTAGAKLARSGKKVLLIEQHDRPGGCATTFKRKDFTLEVGLHEMDGLHPRDMKFKIFRDLDLLGRIEFLKVPEFYRFRNGRQDVVVSHNSVEMIDKLGSMFPDDLSGIRAYYDQVMNIRNIIKQGDFNPKMSVGEYMDSIINNEDLKLILLGNLGYYHDDPYQLSQAYYFMAQNSYYTGGGNYIKGGSQMLSNSLVDIIQESGGEVILNHIVTKIIVENGSATGVEYTSKQGSQNLIAKGSEIIANASIPQVGESLLPNEYAAFKNSYENFEPGTSLLTVYFGFNILPSELGYSDYSTFVYDSEIVDQKDILTNNKGPFLTRSYTFVDYSQIDSALAPSGKAVGAICCMDYTDDWTHLSKAEYKLKKREVEEIFKTRLEQLIPGIRDHIEYCEVGTAKTVKRYTLNPKGAVYGFAQTPERSSVKIESPVNNLHFASAWTQTGGGFSGAIFSGYLCALDIIRKMR